MRFWIGGPRILGLRTGVSFGPTDFRARRQTAVAEGGFVYVVENELGACKIGISRDPIARLAALQTGSPHRLRIAHVAGTHCTGFEIERQAHAFLAGRALGGEWFDCGPSAARHAVQASAEALNRPLVWVDLDQVPQIIALANGDAGAVKKPNNWFYYLLPWVSMFLNFKFLRHIDPATPIESHLASTAVAALFLAAIMPKIMRLAGR